MALVKFIALLACPCLALHTHWVTSQRKLALAEPWGPCPQNSFLFGWTDCKKAPFLSCALTGQGQALMGTCWWVSRLILQRGRWFYRPFPAGSVVKILLANAGNVRDAGSITGSGRSPGGEHSNPLQYSCLENHMDRGVWWATVHSVIKSEMTKAPTHARCFCAGHNLHRLTQQPCWSCIFVLSIRLGLYLLPKCVWGAYCVSNVGTSVAQQTKQIKISTSRNLHSSGTYSLVGVVQSLKSCPTLCNPMNCSPPGSSVHGILQARILEWVALPSSRASFRPRDWTRVSYVSCIDRRVLYHWATWEAQSSRACVLNVCVKLIINVYSRWKIINGWRVSSLGSREQWPGFNLTSSRLGFLFAAGSSADLILRSNAASFLPYCNPILWPRGFVSGLAQWRRKHFTPCLALNTSSSPTCGSWQVSDWTFDFKALFWIYEAFPALWVLFCIFFCPRVSKNRILRHIGQKAYCRFFFPVQGFGGWCWAVSWVAALLQYLLQYLYVVVTTLLTVVQEQSVYWTESKKIKLRKQAAVSSSWKWNAILKCICWGVSYHQSFLEHLEGNNAQTNMI